MRLSNLISIFVLVAACATTVSNAQYRSGTGESFRSPGAMPAAPGISSPSSPGSLGYSPGLGSPGGYGGGPSAWDYSIGSQSALVPPGAACPPRCPEDFANAFRGMPIPVLNWQERNDEIKETIRKLKENVETARHIAKGMEILGRGWIVEYGVSDTISALAAHIITEKAQFILEQSLEELARVTISTQITKIAATTPYFWDLRPDSTEKRRILKDSARELDGMYITAHQGNDGIAFQSVARFAAPSGTSGQILYKPGTAARQAQKIHETVRWANQ
jgi:hypothetical protein